MEDLNREHPYAFERVGFIFCKQKDINGCTLLTFFDYRPVNDEDYIDDRRVGASINSTAIRAAMQFAYDNNCGCFHIHFHGHVGTPAPSFTDEKSLPKVVDAMYNVAPMNAHGYMILSEDSISAYVKSSASNQLVVPDCISIVGYPMKFIYPNKGERSVSDYKQKKESIDDRQTFLGGTMRKNFDNVVVGIIGYGGGGSHIGQQLAHLGIKNIVVYEYDNIEESNLNRLVGATYQDVKDRVLKAKIAKRTIQKILPTARVTCIIDKWQNQPEYLQQCDIVVGCVDTYLGREQLEAECRRYLIPLVDIGMDVHKSEAKSYSMSGQVILSMPAEPCMKCFGFLTDTKLALEAAKYGNVGGRPQVVWPNGVLASSATGILVDLITGWAEQSDRPVYLAYDGNRGLIENHSRLLYASKDCSHYKIQECGPPCFKTL